MVRIRRVSTFHRVCCVSCVSVGARVSVCLVACGGGGPVESAIRDPCSYAGCVCSGCAGQRAVSMAALMAIQERPGLVYRDRGERDRTDM